MPRITESRTHCTSPGGADFVRSHSHSHSHSRTRKDTEES